VSELKADFVNKEPRLKGKAILYCIQPDKHGVYTSILAARTKEELEEFADFLSCYVDAEEIKEVNGGVCLEHLVMQEPTAQDKDYDLIAAKLEPDDKMLLMFPENLTEEKIDSAITAAKAKFTYNKLLHAAIDYFRICDNKHKTTKAPFPTYHECTKKEFLDIFDDLTEGLTEAQDNDEGLKITDDLMRLCKGAPFENTVIPSMCGIANKNHPRRDSLLEMYNTLVHCIVDEDFEVAAELRDQIKDASKQEYRIARYTRNVTDNTFKLPKEIAEDICLNLDALQYLELRENCVIMRSKTKEEEQEDYYHEAGNAVLVEAPEDGTTIVKIPPEMAEKAGIKDRVKIYSLKNRIEIYAVDD